MAIRTRSRVGRLLPLSAAVGVAGLLGTLLISGLDSTGASSTQLALVPGTAWFVSPASGQVSLIDGPTATRIVVRDAAPAGHDLELIQAGNDGFVIDRTDATMRRLDSATFEVGQPITIDVTGDASLRVVANDKALWTTSQRGSVMQQFDPQTGSAMGGPLPFPGTATSTAVMPDGTLWVLDSAIGLVRSFGDDDILTERTHELSDGARILAVGAMPVIADAGNRALLVLDPGTGSVARTTCFDLPPDANILTSGSSHAANNWVIGVLPNAGTAQIADIAANTCRPVALAAPSVTPRYGLPATDSRRVFIPDHTDGSVIVVEPGISPDPVVARIALGLEGHDFRVFEHHSFIWFDDLESDTAGVIDDDLSALLVDKTQGEGLPTPPPDAPAEQPDDQPTPSCTPTPAEALPGQTVRLDAKITPVGTAVATWVWDLSGAANPTAAGPQTQAVWTSPGTWTITLTATTVDSPETPWVAQCMVMIADNTSPTTTSTTIANTEIMPETPETPPTTTTVQTPQTNVSTTIPSSTSPPPITPPPVATTVLEVVPIAPPTILPGAPTTIANSTAGGPGTATSTSTPAPPVATTTTSTAPSATTTTTATTSATTTTTTTTIPPTTTSTSTTLPPATPVPDFTWTPTAPELGDVVQFQDMTAGVHDTTSWTFEGATPAVSNEVAPTATWTTAGSYSVTLTTSNNGSAASVSKQINIVTDGFVGIWRADGTGSLNISRRMDGNLDVHVFGNCSPTACDSGVRLGSMSTDGTQFTLAYNDGVADRSVQVTFVDNDTLTSNWRSVYPPSDSRGILCWTTIYHKNGSGSTTRDASCDPEKFVAMWRGTGTGRLDITSRADGQLDVHVLGDCSPSACDSGVQIGALTADGGGFTMSYNDGVADRLVQAAYLDADTLTTSWRSTYPAGDNRGILCWTSVYRKGSAGSTEQDPSCIPEKFVGTWRAAGTGQLVITVRSDGNLDVHVYGDCTPTGCDVGVQRGTLSGGGSGFTLSYNDGVANRAVQVTFVDNDTLTSTWRSTYPTGSPRCWNTTYRKSTAGSTTIVGC